MLAARARCTVVECADEEGSCVAVTQPTPGTIEGLAQFAEASLSADAHGLAARRTPLNIAHERTCDCPSKHLNCLTAKEWTKYQVAIWRFSYEARDIRDKNLHPATFPIALAKRAIELFTHKGELVLDPFVGSGTTLVAAQDLDRNALGFDLQPQYLELSKKRLAQRAMLNRSEQLAICDDARSIPSYLRPESVGLIFTSPPYANMLNRRRRNKSRRSDDRKNDQYLKVEQYSQDPRDLGTLHVDDYARAMADIFKALLPLLRPRAHCVVNITDLWCENQRLTTHMLLTEAFRGVGYELRNIIIWDRTNVVNRIGIFGWPSNYITLGTTFEYLLDFWRPGGSSA
ncbi:MAG: site-specific DNA-methyltransferase [Chloroflexi bacterium]|nr:site-specific DNA-methyltransferase [Chloroflexota bacterium]